MKCSLSLAGIVFVCFFWVAMIQTRIRMHLPSLAARYDVAGHTPMIGDLGTNLLERTDIYYNVLLEKVERKCRYFQSFWAACQQAVN